MIRIKTIEFFQKEYDGPRTKLILLSCLGSISFAFLLALVNWATELEIDTNYVPEMIMAAIYIAVGTLSILCKRFTLNRATVIIQGIIRQVRLRLVDKLRHTELTFLENTDKGNIYARIVHDTELILHAAPNFVSSFEAALASLAVFVYMAFVSMTGFLLAFAGIAALYAIFFSNYFKIKEMVKSARMKEADFYDGLNDTIRGFKEIRINTAKNNDLFADVVEITRQSEQLKTESEIALDRNVVIAFIMYEIILGVLVFIIPLFNDGHGEVVTEMVASVLFFFGLSNMAIRGVYSITRSNVAVENITRLEEALDSAGNFAAPAHAQSAAATDTFEDFSQISLRSVSFHYTGKEDEPLFTVGPLNLDIKRGEAIFIVGGNGSGKSTLLKVLTGLYYPEGNGYISVDKKRVARNTYQAYRELFSAIFTDFHLFKKLYGVDDVDEAKVNEFLEIMDLDRKTSFSEGRFTRIDLSTGQKKRLAYITALLEDKQIYVFDEWAADQDPVFRKHFYEKFLRDLRRMNKTIIAVTHDDRYFDCADRVIVMKDGRIVER